MLRKICLFLVPWMLVASSSCSDDKEPIVTQITVSAENLTRNVPQEGETFFVPIAYDAGLYNVETDSPAWCKTEYTGNGSRFTGINITASLNDRAASRVATVTLSAKTGEPVVITLTQSGAAPELSVVEQAVRIKNTLSFTLHVVTNVDQVDFELPQWITLNAQAPAPEEGTHEFTVEAIPAQEDTRSGDIVVKVAGAASVVVRVSQSQPSGPLPVAPAISKPQLVASLVDMSFKEGGYLNYATLGAEIDAQTGKPWFEVSTPGTEGAPKSVYDPVLKCYVASYPEENANIFYKVDYQNSERNENKNTNVPAGPKYLQDQFSFEVYFKATNVGSKWVRPVSSIHTKNGNQGFGLDINNKAVAQFLIAKDAGWSSPFAGQFAVSASQYYHVIFTVDRIGAQEIKCYLNGVKQGNTIPYTALWLDLSWDVTTHRWIGIGGNTGDNNTITDPMTGEIAFFRLYSDVVTEAEAAQRYQEVTARAGYSNVDALNTMLTVSIPAKLQEELTAEHTKALTEAVDLGWALMANIEATESDIAEFLTYANLLLNYE